MGRPFQILPRSRTPGSDVADAIIEKTGRRTLDRRHSQKETPEEQVQIAKAVTFLASADASYVTGTELSVDGGRTEL